MQLFYWDELYNTGVESIDEQHQKLLDLINELAEAFTHSKTLPEINQIYIQLFEYCQFHFSEEEALLEKSALSVDFKSRHIKQHKAFLTKLDMLANSSTLSDENAVAILLEFLSAWLIAHILGTDQQLAQSLGAEPYKPSDRDKEYDLVSALRMGEDEFYKLTHFAPVMIRAQALQQDGKIVFNHAWNRFTGVDPLDNAKWSDICGQNVSNLIKFHQSDLPTSANLEYKLFNANGDQRLLLEYSFYSSPPSQTNPAEYLISITVDQTLLRESENLLGFMTPKNDKEAEGRIEEIKDLIISDPSSVLKNKQEIFNKLAAELAKSNRFKVPFSALLIEIHHLEKHVSKVEQTSAEIMLSHFVKHISFNLRGVDSVGRISLNQFLVLLPITDEEKAKIVAKRFNRALAELNLEEGSHHFTSNLVLAQRGEEVEADQLLLRMQQALGKRSSSTLIIA